MNTKFHDPLDEPLTEDIYLIWFRDEIEEEQESEQLERRWEIGQ